MSAGRKVLAVTNLREFFKNSVDSALTNQQVDVDDHTAHYVVNLLTMFARSEELYEQTSDGYRLKPLALMLADAVECHRERERNLLLQRLGDVALFISGYFSASLQRRPVGVDYYVAMGGNAYGFLSDTVRGTLAGQALSPTFAELSQKFREVVSVIGEISESQIYDHDDILRLYEYWMHTGSRRAGDALRRLGVDPVAGSAGPTRH